MAGGFNSPLMGAVFTFEELTGRFQAQVLWPSAVVCSLAALISNLTGTPIFILASIQSSQSEWLQLMLAVPLGLGAGALGTTTIAHDDNLHIGLEAPLTGSLAELGDGMLDLEAGVDLEEPEGALCIEHELDGPGAHVAERRTSPTGCL